MAVLMVLLDSVELGLLVAVVMVIVITVAIGLGTQKYR